MPAKPSRSRMKESDLFLPISNYLESQGYEVKAEVEHCDVVGMRGDEPPLIVELKTTLNLELVLQAADRLQLTDSVYIAFPSKAPLWRRHWRRVRTLCRRLGVGIITIEIPSLKVEVRLDPAPYQPRPRQVRSYRLLAEFEHRVGNTNVGGVTRQPLMTAYRQDALRCVVSLAEGPLSVAEIRTHSDVARASSILQKDYYGWFERVSRGYYQLSPKGVEATQLYEDVVSDLKSGANVD